MKQLSLKEIQDIELNILKYIDETCKKNGIDYMVVGGTAIGTIRHNGFIPWDDDIDIGLTPENYNKLLECLKKQQNKQFKLLDHTTEETYPYPFAKLVDTRTKVIENNRIEINNFGVYVDIFMYHGLPERKLPRLLSFYKLKIYQACFDYLAQKKIPQSKGIKKLVKICIKRYAQIVGRNKLIKKCEKLWYKYPIEKTTYCTSIWPCVARRNQILNSKVFLETIRHKFENIEVNIMKEYDNYLTNAYGDYMKLPPVEKRKAPHPANAKWKEKENDK